MWRREARDVGTELVARDRIEHLLIDRDVDPKTMVGSL
jgi:hypothetical protein